jgi:hypothetical protein
VSQRTRITFNPFKVIQRSNLSVIVFLISLYPSPKESSQLESLAAIHKNQSYSVNHNTREEGEYTHKNQNQPHNTRTRSQESKHKDRVTRTTRKLRSDLTRTVGTCCGRVSECSIALGILWC